MSKVRSPKYRILYNQKNITSDVSVYLSSLTYADAIEKKADEVQIEFTNTSGIWLDEWYPTMGDTLDIWMGYEEQMFPCGTFQIDEFSVSFGPDMFKVKGIAAGVKSAVRTKRSYAHENKTLRQIAQNIADRYGFSLTGNILDTGQIPRETQKQETDLEFLDRLSCKYGHSFSLRGGKVVFTNVYQLEAAASATLVSRSDIQPGSGSIKDKTYDTYQKLHLAHYDTNSKKLLETTFEFPVVSNVDGFAYNDIIKKDIKEIRERFDNADLGQSQAMAALHSSNSKQQEGILTFVGNPFILSGNNFTLTECGKLSGIYHVVQSIHKISDGGYTTSARFKRVGFITIDKIKKKRVHKPIPIRAIVTK